MKIGSLFSGIGGLELGLERAGVGRTVWQCECDQYALRVLAKHWPDATRFTDVRAMDESTPPVDVICGGFPCQDISNAGRREGIRGERSGLFYELMRVVRLVRPRYVVLENVAALLGRGMGDVLGELSESGFDAEWDCVPASSVGAPHQRDRIFILGFARVVEASGSAHVADAGRAERRARAAAGHDADGQDPGRPLERAVGERTGAGGQPLAPADAHGDRREGRIGRAPSEGQVVRESVVVADGAPADADEGGLSRRRVHDSGWGKIVRTQCERGWEPEPDVGRVAHGVPRRVDRLRCLGNAVVPQVAEVVGRALLAIAEREGLTP